MPLCVLITGANRGIGLELVKQYLTDSNYSVIACCRQVASAQDLAQLHEQYPQRLVIKPLDIVDRQSQMQLQDYLQSANVGLDCVWLNAGMYGDTDEQFEQVSIENMQQVIFTNSIAQFKLAQIVWPFMQASLQKNLVVMTSKVGSIGDNSSGGRYSYRASKAALNSMMRSLAMDLYDSGLRLILMHPGWVKTDMGGVNALITTEQSVAGMRQVVAERAATACGDFVDYQGQDIPW